MDGCNGDSLAVANLDGPLYFTMAKANVARTISGVEVSNTGRSGSLTASVSGEFEGFVEKHSGHSFIDIDSHLIP